MASKGRNKRSLNGEERNIIVNGQNADAVNGNNMDDVSGPNAKKSRGDSR